MSAQPTSLSDKNSVFFDSLASASSRQPWMIELVNQVQSELISRLDWIGIPSQKKDVSSSEQQQPSRPIRLLDYGCGAGELSRALFPHVTSIRGIDVSSAMVKAYNDHAREANIPEEKMFAVRGDILASPSDNDKEAAAPPPPPPAFMERGNKEWSDFDVVVMSMTLHHVGDPAAAVAKLVERLRPGGSLVIVDWGLGREEAGPGSGDGERSNEDRKQEGGHHHHHQDDHNPVPSSKDTITRAGFGQEEMEQMFRNAGCVEEDGEGGGVEVVEFRERTRLGDGEGAVMQRLFVARGVRKGEKS
ncbi:MAG: hypothetical protein Q9219_004783 [cf. Caloplaca sp. 3 TL-2023]